MSLTLIWFLIELFVLINPSVHCYEGENMSKGVASVNISAFSIVKWKSSVYDITEKTRDIGDPYIWIDVEVKVKDRTAHEKLVQEQVPTPGRVQSSFFVPQPVYISLTTMAGRMGKVNRTITSLIQAKVRPTMIYLMISKEPFLLDEGVRHIPDELLCLIAEGYLQIVYTENLGPHRKLLPALRRHWGEDVFIATVDDDMRRDQGYIILYQLLKHYVLGGGGDRVVALRARRIALCSLLPYKITKYYAWPVQMTYNRAEMLVVPTGTGGILYKPSYFHKVVFHKSLRFATGTADDLMFRLSTLVNRIPVQLGCSIMRYRAQVVRYCPEDKYDRKYDSTYGTESRKYFKALTSEITRQMQADVAAADAAKEKEALKQKKKERLAQVTNKAVAAAPELDTTDAADSEVVPLHPRSKAGGKRGDVRGASQGRQQGRRGHRQLLLVRGSVPIQEEEVEEEDAAAEGLSEQEDMEGGEWAEERAVVEALQLACALQHGVHGGSSLVRSNDSVTAGIRCCGKEVAEANVKCPRVFTEGEQEQQWLRRLAKTVRYRGVPRNGGEKDLFTINRRGGNDIAWNLAVDVLKSMDVMDIEEITSAYVREREDFCYEKQRSTRIERFCALFDCDETKKVKIGNSTVVQRVTANNFRRKLS